MDNYKAIRLEKIILLLIELLPVKFNHDPQVLVLLDELIDEIRREHPTD